MTHVEDSITWCSPYLSASRYASDLPAEDREKWKAIGHQKMANRGVNANAMMELAKSLPFGYVGNEGEKGLH